MPVDDFGNRAELIVDPLATIGRSILGREYEPKLNAVFRDLASDIHRILGTNEAMCDKSRLAVLDKTGVVYAQYLRLVELYNITSPDYMGVTYTPDLPKSEIYEHMASVLSGNRTLFMPPENEPRKDHMVMKLNEIMPNNISPVTYRGNSGKVVRTKEDVLIASSYFLALDKPGEDWAAINSGRLQHYGILARINSATKYTMAIRHQPTQVFGETEFRIIVSNTPWYVAAELIDRNNSRTTMEEGAWQLLSVDDPSNIDVLIDRKKIPYGEARPLQMTRHINEGYGFRNKYVPYVPTWSKHAN